MEFIVLSPLFAGVVLLVLLAAGRRLPRWLRTTAAIGLGLCYLLATPLGADPLLHAIEARAASTCAAPTPRAVVVLGGGVAENARPGDVGALNGYSLRRVIGAVRWWRRLPPATPFVISGGNVYGGPAEAALMARLAEQLGVPRAQIRVDDRARNTWQNARNLAAMTPPLPTRVWLVTSAVHMPRALYAFRAAGFAPCAVPVDYRATRPHPATALLPTVESITRANLAIHELVGMAWYRLKAAWC